MTKGKKLADNSESTTQSADRSIQQDHLLDSRIKRQLLYLGYETFTEIQQNSINTIINNFDKDYCIKGQTGSGKTLAYLLPVFHRLYIYEKDKRQRMMNDCVLTDDNQKLPVLSRATGVRALIIVPSRELSIQIEMVCKKLAQQEYWVCVLALVCGAKRKNEKSSLRKGVTILISTPGRLKDHLESTNSLKLANLQSIVIDEVDRLVDDGFEKKLVSILDAVENIKNDQFESALASHSHQSGSLKPFTVTENRIISELLKTIKETTNTEEAPATEINSTETPAKDQNESLPLDLLQKYELKLNVFKIIVSATVTSDVTRVINKMMLTNLVWITDNDNIDTRHDDNFASNLQAKDHSDTDHNNNNSNTTKSEVINNEKEFCKIPKQLRLSAIVCSNPKYRLLTVLSLLLLHNRRTNGGTLIFVNSCSMVEYIYNLLSFLVWPNAPSNLSKRKQEETAKVSQKKRKILDYVQNEVGEDNIYDVEDVLFSSDATSQHLPHDVLFSSEPVFSGVKFFRLHGELEPLERTNTTKELNQIKNKKYVIVATDVAARGLDFPNLNLVIQYEPPLDISDYVHRVGRTARINNKGVAVMVLDPQETHYVNYVKKSILRNSDADIKVTNESAVLDVLRPKLKVCLLPDFLQSLRADDSVNYILSRFTTQVSREKAVNKLAVNAFFAYVKTYKCYPPSVQEYLNFKNLHIGKLAGSLFIKQSPKELKFDFVVNDRPLARSGLKGRSSSDVSHDRHSSRRSSHPNSSGDHSRSSDTRKRNSSKFNDKKLNYTNTTSRRKTSFVQKKR